MSQIPLDSTNSVSFYRRVWQPVATEVVVANSRYGSRYHTTYNWILWDLKGLGPYLPESLYLTLSVHMVYMVWHQLDIA